MIILALNEITSDIMNVLQEAGFPGWSKFIVFPLIIALLFSMLILLLNVLVFTIPSLRSKRFKRQGHYAQAHVYDTKTETHVNEGDSPSTTSHYAFYRFQTADGKEVKKKYLCRTASDMRAMANKTYKVYYSPKWPRNCKLEKDMDDIEEMRLLPSKIVRAFAFTFLTTLLIMVIATAIRAR